MRSGETIRQQKCGRSLIDSADSPTENGTEYQDKQTRTDVLVLNRALSSLQKWATLANGYEKPGKATKDLRSRVNSMIQQIEEAIAELEAEEK